MDVCDTHTHTHTTHTPHTTHIQYTVSEKEVMDLERTYWSLKSGITTGGSARFDLETFIHYTSPPVPEAMCKGIHCSCTCMCVYTL